MAAYKMDHNKDLGDGENFEKLNERIDKMETG
jgi:hypothetical protein